MAAEKTVSSFVAVDIGSYSLKFAFFDLSAAKPVLSAVAHFPIPQFTRELSAEKLELMSREDVENHYRENLRKFLTKHLTELLYDNRIETKQALSFASGREVTIRCFGIPPVAQAELLKMAVQDEAGRQMPFSMENAVLGFTVGGDMLRDDATLTQVAAAALQRDTVDFITLNLKGGGLSNEGILILPQALALGLPTQLSETGSDQRTAIIHCGHRTTAIMVFKDGVLQFYRDINMGGETITEAILAGGEQDGETVSFATFEEATEIKHRIGILPPDEMSGLTNQEKFVAGAIFASLEKILQHIQLSISFYISQSGEPGIDAILLSGGSTAMVNFKEFIMESLEIPTEHGDPFIDIDCGSAVFPIDRRAPEAPALAAAMGAARYQPHADIINFIDILYPTRKQQSGTDFSGVGTKFGASLSEKIFSLNEAKLRILAAALVGILFLLGAFPVIQARRAVTNAKSDYQKLQRQLRDFRASQVEVSKLLEEKEKLQRAAGFPVLVRQQWFPYGTLLQELASNTPDTIFLQRAEISIDGNQRKTLSLTGHTDTNDRVFDYLRFLSLSPLFKHPTLQGTTEEEIDEDRYFVSFTVTCAVEAQDPRVDTAAEEHDIDEHEDIFDE